MLTAVLFSCIGCHSIASRNFDTVEGGQPQAVSIATPVVASSLCPSDMVEVNGDYCPNEEQVCLYNTDADGNRLPGPGDIGKACGEYKQPTRCLSDKVHMHFCIDKYEFPNKEGQKPQDWMSYFDAVKAVEAVGKRICTHKEWTLAAEGPNMHPLPYGDGYHRDKSKCNFDNHNPGIDVFQSKTPNDEASQRLRDLLVPSGSKDCVSDFGVHDMSGNIDEWVVNESSQDMCINKTSGNCRTGLMGGHIWHVRNASRPMTTAHGAGFSWYETGARGCKSL
jgi:formylglycine-generating enzyme required for sulfatase activity